MQLPKFPTFEPEAEFVFAQGTSIPDTPWGKPPPKIPPKLYVFPPAQIFGGKAVRNAPSRQRKKHRW